MPERGSLIDGVVAAYAVLAGAALLFPHRPGSWPLLAAGHLALFGLALWIGRNRRSLERRGGRRWVRVVVDWYPLLIIPLLYTELDFLNTAVWGGRYFDGVILEVEERIFGGQPSTTLARSAPWLTLSEVLHGAYLSYYPIIYVPPLVLYLQGRRAEFRTTLMALITAFLVHYMVFIYFPVQGPRYLFPAPGGRIAEGFMYGLAHRILEAGSSEGAAFPSSHVGVAVVQTVAAFRFLPRAAPFLLAATLGLAVGAVYGGFHYAIDAIAGALAGLAIALPLLAMPRRSP